MHKKQHIALKIFFYLSTILLLFTVNPSPAQAQFAKTYKEAIQKGNSELNIHKLFDAKAYFQMALRYKPGDSLANNKIEKIIKILKKQASKQEVYYNLIDQADAYFEKGALDLAIEGYKKALRITPGDKYAQGKINEIIREKTEKKQKRAAYLANLKRGTKLLGHRQFEAAISAFEMAQKIYPGEKTAVEKILLARQLQKEYSKRRQLAVQEVKTAQRYLLIKDYSSAMALLQKADSLLPGNAVLLAKIHQIEPLVRKQTAYNLKAGEADKLYIAKNYMAAKMKYQEAAAIWPESPYPKDMIARIDITLLAQRAHLDENYQAAIHKADSLFKISELDNAKAEYTLALNLKPNEDYPKTQLKIIALAYKKELEHQQANYIKLIKKANSLFAQSKYLASRNLFSKAVTIKPGDAYPREKLKEISQKIAERIARQREIDNNYQKQILLGRGLKAERRWAEEKKAYELALSLKPGEAGPRQAIQQIDSITNQIAIQVKINKAYKQAFSNGELLLAKKSYQPALGSFQKAKALKPLETAPNQQIKIIRNILAEIARKKALNEAVQKTIQKADSLLKQKKYELALKQYRTALSLKENETYPKEKINEIKEILLRLEKEKEQHYATTISKADQLFQIKNYQEALTQYQVALNIKPMEAYPKQQIAQCKQFLAAMLQRQKIQYNKIIVEADQYYADKIFDKAIDAYKKAHIIKADETYPLKMVHKITKYIEDNAIEDILKQKVLIQANVTKQFAFKPVPVTVRKSNYVLIKAHNIDGKAFKVIFVFGKGHIKNGGFVIQVPKGKVDQEFIIRVGSQYKWFSENNNWISVFPENNPLQISLIRISKTD